MSLCQEPAACRATSSRVILFLAVQRLGYEGLTTKPSIHLMRAHVITASFLPHPPICFWSFLCPASGRSHPHTSSEVVPASHPVEERTASTCQVCEGEGTLSLLCPLAGLGSTPEPLWPRGRQRGSSLWGPNMAPGERACPAQTHLRWRSGASQKRWWVPTGKYALHSLLPELLRLVSTGPHPVHKREWEDQEHPGDQGVLPSESLLP